MVWLLWCCGYSGYRCFIKFVDKFYLSDYFINLSKVHMVPCTRSFVVTCQRVYRTVCIFYLALSSTALQVGGESYLTPFLSWCVQHSFHLPISGFLFLFFNVCCPTPCPFEKISRALLRSWGFYFGFLLQSFLGEAPKLSENLIAISERSGLEVMSQYFRRSHILLLGL